MGRWLTVIIACIQVVFVIFVVVFHFMPAHRMRRLTAHKERLNALYGYLHFDRQLPLLVPLMFMGKRFVFAMGVYFTQDPYFQILAFSAVSMANLVLVLHSQPFIDPQMLQLEVFNEAITILFVNLMLAFKPDDSFLSQPDQFYIAWYVVGLLVFYILVHLTF